LELANPNALLEKILEFFTPEFEGKKIQVKTEFCENEVRVLLDPKLFREVVVNIAQNSIAAIEEKANSGIVCDEKNSDSKEFRGVFAVRTATKNDK
ncbi:MAG: hypothetical protein K2H67_03615, partial [Treponemataceae bacterium]|nr:hypothetical protein [Treponemataceae bacterium]